MEVTMGKHILSNGEELTISELSGKMKGINALSTSVMLNPFCFDMYCKEGMICQSCYARSGEYQYEGARNGWLTNYRLLSESLLKAKDIPHINASIFRFQSHGELINRTHYKNLIRIAEANPDTMFGFWTKNLKVIRKGGLIKRDNIVYVFSSFKKNVLNPVVPEGFDKVFTVFNRPFLAKHPEVDINCTQQCNTCRLCYSKNDVIFVNEKIKYSGDPE
jgi:hypothetical protein